MKYEIYSNGEKINTIIADEAFCKKYCEKNGYTFEPVPDPAPTPDPEPSAEELLDILLGGADSE